jgi:hypothetical protein
MEFVRQLWGNMGFTMPGMVAPTFNSNDLEKQITDLKAVEGWLRMNLSMLQMTIQGLEMQQTTLTTVKAVGKMIHSPNGGASEADSSPSVGDTLQRAALWPLEVMQQMQDGLQKHLDEEARAAAERAESAAAAAAAAPKLKTAAKTAPRKPAKKPA